MGSIASPFITSARSSAQGLFCLRKRSSNERIGYCLWRRGPAGRPRRRIHLHQDLQSEPHRPFAGRKRAAQGKRGQGSAEQGQGNRTVGQAAADEVEGELRARLGIVSQ